jgi:glycosyltransferase involved in cell wall biosynthesis
MQVVVCSDGVFPAELGGIQRHTRLLVEHVARRHQDVELIVVHPHEGSRFFEGLANVREVTVSPRPGRRQYLLECWELSARMAEVLRRHPGAVVYSQGIAVLQGIGEFSDRLIVNPHGLEAFQALTFRSRMQSLPFRIAITRAMRHARLVVSLGGRLTDILSRVVPRDRICVLPNGVEMPAEGRSAGHARGETLRVLFVGRFFANKGIPDLIEAARLIDRSGESSSFSFDLVGDGPLFDSIRGSVSMPNIRFHGKVGDARLDSLYSEADVFVLPTLFEGMPTVVLEAMARGLPILVTDVGATRELVDSSNGVIIPKRDPQAIVRELRRLRDMPSASFAALGAASREKAAGRFAWSRVADDHVAAFRRVLSGNPKR